MSIIKIPINFEGELGEKTLYTLFDSGSTYSCIRPEFVKDLVTPIKFKTPLHFGTASEGAYIEVKERCTLDFFMNDVHLTDEFLLSLDFRKKPLLGPPQCRSGESNWILKPIGPL